MEVMWLVGRLAPDHKTIADFRKDNGGVIREVCARFVALCRHRNVLWFVLFRRATNVRSWLLADIAALSNLCPLYPRKRAFWGWSCNVCF